MGWSRTKCRGYILFTRWRVWRSKYIWDAGRACAGLWWLSLPSDSKAHGFDRGGCRVNRVWCAVEVCLRCVCVCVYIWWVCLVPTRRFVLHDLILIGGGGWEKWIAASFQKTQNDFMGCRFGFLSGSRISWTSHHEQQTNNLESINGQKNTALQRRSSRSNKHARNETSYEQKKINPSICHSICILIFCTEF